MRSKLFVPAIRPGLFEKALGYGSDAVCFDLEDSVAMERKAEARGHVRGFLELRNAKSTILLVRINQVGSAEFLADLDAAVWPSVAAIALPKVESADAVHTLQAALRELEAKRGITEPLGILPTIESAKGLRLAVEIGQASPRIAGLQVGFADLLEPLGIAGNNQFVRDEVRFMLRLAAAEAEIDCYDSAIADFGNPEALQAHLDAGRACGFAGSSCIHPNQIAATNRTYTPTESEIAFATRLVQAAEEAALVGSVVTSVDGKMVDRPFIEGAKRLLARASLRNSE